MTEVCWCLILTHRCPRVSASGAGKSNTFRTDDAWLWTCHLHGLFLSFSFSYILFTTIGACDEIDQISCGAVTT